MNGPYAKFILVGTTQPTFTSTTRQAILEIHVCFLESPNFTSRDRTSGGPPVYKIIRIVGIIRIMGFIGGRVFLEETQYLEAILADIDLKRKNAYNNTNFCKSLLQVRGRHVYKHESDDRWIGMCPGQWLGRLGWCIGVSSTMETKGPVAYGKITQCARMDLNKRFLPKPMTTTG